MDKKNCIWFLSTLEGYHSQLKMLHWSTTNYHEHKLCDDINEAILDYQDRFAEATMGHLHTRFNVGEVKSLLPESTQLQALLKELESDVLKMKEYTESDNKTDGIMNILDDILESVNSWDYLATLK